jgi:hypothetical protein
VHKVAGDSVVFSDYHDIFSFSLYFVVVVVVAAAAAVFMESKIIKYTTDKIKFI